MVGTIIGSIFAVLYIPLLSVIRNIDISNMFGNFFARGSDDFIFILLIFAVFIGGGAFVGYILSLKEKKTATIGGISLLLLYLVQVGVFGSQSSFGAGSFIDWVIALGGSFFAILSMICLLGSSVKLKQKNQAWGRRFALGIIVPLIVGFLALNSFGYVSYFAVPLFFIVFAVILLRYLRKILRP